MGDQAIDRQPARQVQRGEHREIGLGPRRAVGAAEHRAAIARQLEGVEAGREPVVGHAHEDGAATTAGQLDRVLDRARKADRLEDVVGAVREKPPERVGVVRSNAVRGADRPCELELLVVEVDRNDRVGGCEHGAHHDREANAAAADHDHRCAGGNGSGVEHGTDAGRDRAADQRAHLGRQRCGHRHGSSRRQNGALGERSNREVRPHALTAVTVEARRAVGHQAFVRAVPLAEPLPARCAHPAGAAWSEPAEHDPVAACDVADALADLLDDAAAFVPEHERRRLGPLADDDVQVGVAHAGRLEPDRDLAASRVVEPERLDRHRLLDAGEHRGSHRRIPVAIRAYDSRARPLIEIRRGAAARELRVLLYVEGWERLDSNQRSLRNGFTARPL